MVNVMAAIQAAVEYGGTAGGNVGMAAPPWAQNTLSWADEHRLILLGVVALLVILGFSGTKRRS